MPKRVIDFDAMWASDKIAACADWAQAEYAWLYGLADASGCFELTNLRVIWGRVSSIRKDFPLERLANIFDEFIAHGLLFTWEENGKRYAHWTGSDVPGRLPAPSWRARLEHLAPAIPRGELAAYTSRYAARRRVPAIPESCSTAVSLQTDATRHDACAGADTQDTDCRTDPQLKACLEVSQAQDLNLNLNLNSDERKEWENTPVGEHPVSPAHLHDKPIEETDGPARLLAIYESQRGVLPAAERLTAERRRNCRLRITGGLSCEAFRAAVERAARTPFLAGSGDRGWRANFDWFVANDTNIRKVLEGCYDPPESFAEVSSDVPRPSWTAQATPTSGMRGSRKHGSSSQPAELYAGLGPQASESRARVKPAALERIRARTAAAQLPLCVETAEGHSLVQGDAGNIECDRRNDFAPRTTLDAPGRPYEPVRAGGKRSIRQEKAS